jgi:spermidine synthase
VGTTGIGRAFRHFPRSEAGLRVGVVGLGIGTLAAWGQKGDVHRFYEINPEVERQATSRFTYLADSAAECEIVMGDGRLSLEREEKQDYHILVLDAFRGDAVPVHLLTREAFEVYLPHVRDDGLIIVNISNRYLNLKPVVRALAEHFGLHAAHIRTRANEKREISGCDWILLSRQRAFLERDPIAKAALPPEAAPGRVLWTDHYSSLFAILK